MGVAHKIINPYKTTIFISLSNPPGLLPPALTPTLTPALTPLGLMPGLLGVG
jgi:hypothetical protein